MLQRKLRCARRHVLQHRCAPAGLAHTKFGLPFQKIFIFVPRWQRRRPLQRRVPRSARQWLALTSSLMTRQTRTGHANPNIYQPHVRHRTAHTGHWTLHTKKEPVPDRTRHETAAAACSNMPRKVTLANQLTNQQANQFVRQLANQQTAPRQRQRTTIQIHLPRQVAQYIHSTAFACCCPAGVSIRHPSV